MSRENGFALPMVVFVLMIAVFICFFLVSQFVRHRQSAMLTAEMLHAQYAAESGIALMQHQLRQNPNNNQPISFQQRSLFVFTKVVHHGPSIEIVSKSVGRYGVRQTIRVTIDPKTLAIREWIK